VAGTWADRWQVLVRHERAAEWLRVWADLGRAPRTIDAYARVLGELSLPITSFSLVKRRAGTRG
jgi:hypothetical protein